MWLEVLDAPLRKRTCRGGGEVERGEEPEIEGFVFTVLVCVVIANARVGGPNHVFIGVGHSRGCISRCCVPVDASSWKYCCDDGRSSHGLAGVNS